MKHLNLFFSVLSLVILSTYSNAQVLISDEVIFSPNYPVVSNSDQLYFNEASTDYSMKGIYHLDQNESLDILLVDSEIQFEKNGLLYSMTSGNVINTTDLTNHSTTVFYSDTDVLILSRQLAHLNDNFYFVGYSNGEYLLFRLDLNGALLMTTVIPGPVQNTIRVHESGGFIYVSSNIISPAVTHYYRYDPVISMMDKIGSQDYPAFPFIFPLQEIEINSEKFSINSAGQLTSDLNQIDLTCFNLTSSEEDSVSPTLIGSQGENIYMSLEYNDVGTPNGIYRFPEKNNEGLCDDPAGNEDAECCYSKFELSGSESIELKRHKVINGDLYILGSTGGDEARAIVTKQDLSGNLEWQYISDQPAEYRDLEIDGDKVVLIGNTLPIGSFNTAWIDNQSLITILSTSGNEINTLFYDNQGRESFHRIVRHPNAQNPRYPLYVAGFDNRGTVSPSSLDRVRIMNMDNNGNVNWVRYYASGKNDDELARQLLTMSDGSLVLIGNYTGLNGVIWKINGTDGAVIAAREVQEWEQLRRAHLIQDDYIVAITRSRPNISGISLLDKDLNAIKSWDMCGPEILDVSSIDVIDNTIYIAVVLASREIGVIEVKLNLTGDIASSKLYLDDPSQFSLRTHIHEENGILSRSYDSNSQGGSKIYYEFYSDNLDKSCLTFEEFCLRENIITINDSDIESSVPELPVVITDNILVSSTFDLNTICNQQDSTCIFDCSEECSSSQLNLSSGISTLDETLLDIGDFDANWILTSGPDEGVNYPRPAYVLNPFSSWADLEGSQYISALPSTRNNLSNSQSGLPYEFEKCFCICADDSRVNIDLKAYADNLLKVSLYDSDDNIVTELINIDVVSTAAFTGLPDSAVLDLTLDEGVYCLKAELRNDGQGTAMGMNIQASVTGAGLIEGKCCKSFNAITGIVFKDDNCDGVFDDFPENGIAGSIVQLCQDTSVIATLTTDSYGYYTFSNIAPGNYMIKSLESDLVATSPRIVPILVEDNRVFNVDFAYGEENCENIDSTCIFECSPECAATTVNLSTGLDAETEEFLPTGSHEANWQLISAPNDVSVPYPAYVLNPNSVWEQLSGSQYISAFPNAQNNDNNIQNETYYEFEKCFCVCEDNAKVNIDLKAYVDNLLEIDLYDGNENYIQNLLSITDRTTGAFTGDPTLSSTDLILPSDVYCLRARMQNDGSVTMGMSIEAFVSGVGLIGNGCCKSYNAVTGSVFHDIACDGEYNFATDTAMSLIDVQLCQDEVVLYNFKTDGLGYFTFNNVEPGDYTVKCLYSGQLTPSTPNTYDISVTDNSVVGNINFGYCDSPCEPDEESPVCILDRLNLNLDNNEVFILSSEDIDAGSFDDCSDIKWEFSKTEFTCKDAGDNVIDVTLTDAAGNQSTCCAIVTIERCPDKCCATSEELTAAANEAYNASSVVFRNISTSIVAQGRLYGCQNISRISWGDGTVEEIRGNRIPSHVYRKNGAYVVSIEIVAVDEDGEICQVDIVDFVIAYKRCKQIAYEPIGNFGFNLFPSPAIDELNVTLNENRSGVTVRIMDVQGREMDRRFFKSKSNFMTLDVKDLVPGVYFLELVDPIDNAIYTSRFLKH